MNTGSITADAGARRFSRRVAWTIGVKVLVAASSLISGMIVARWLGAAGVGVVASLGVVTMVALNIGGLGSPSSTTFLVARDTWNARPAFINSIIFALLCGAMIAGVIISLANVRPQFFGDIPPRLVTIAAFALPVQMLSYLSLAIYLGLERIRSYNLADLSLQAVILVNTVVTLTVLGLGINELVIVGTVANVVVGIAIAAVLGRSLSGASGHWLPDLDLLREMVRYGLRFLVTMAAGTIIMRGDLLIVNYFRGTDEAGVYAVATQAATLMQMMPAVVSTILFPRTASKQDASGSMTCRVTRHAVAIMLVACLAAGPLSFLLPLLYGAAFNGVPVQFIVMLPGVFLLGIETIQVQHFTGLGLPKTIPMFWLLTMAVSIGLNIWFVPVYGAIAAAAVSSISYALIFVLVAALFSSRTGSGFYEMFVLRRGELAALINASVAREGKA